MKILFFDFDGTISNSKNIANKTLKQVLKKHIPNYNYTFKAEKQIKSLIGLKLRDILQKLTPKIKKQQQNKIKREFYKQAVKQAHTLKFCTSITPLKQLKQDNNTKLILISNSNQHFIKASIKQLKIQTLFNKIYYLEDKKITKDKLLKQLFKKYKIKPKQTAYIGDRTSDITYAKSAGCISIAINNKCAYSTLKEIKAQKPDYIIKNFAQLKNIINQTPIHSGISKPSRA